MGPLTIHINYSWLPVVLGYVAPHDGVQNNKSAILGQLLQEIVTGPTSSTAEKHLVAHPPKKLITSQFALGLK